MGVIAIVLISLALILIIGIASTGIHRIEEGQVGIYYIGGKLSDSISYPGINYHIPFLSTFESIPINIQTITINNVEVRYSFSNWFLILSVNVKCGTSGGVELTFERIEVVTR